MATTPPTTVPPLDVYPEGEGNVMPSHLHDLALTLVVALLRGLFAPQSLVVREVPLMNNPHDLRDYLEPDLMVVFGVGELDPVYGVLRRQYRVWDEGRVPDLVVEAAS